MTLTVNGETQTVEAETLADLVERLGFADAVVATALNGSFVTASARGQAPLNQGDRVEILAPMQGG